MSTPDPARAPSPRPKSGVEAATERALAAWVGFVTRFPASVSAVAAMLAVASLVLTATSIGINTDTRDLLSAELPYRQNQIAMRAAFPRTSRSLLLVVDRPGATVAEARRDAMTVADALAEKGDVLGDVFYPAADPFFRRYGILYLDIAALEALSVELAAAQPFLGTLWADPNFRGLAGLISLAGRAGEDQEEAGLETFAAIIGAMADVTDQRLGDASGRLDWQAWLGGGGPTRDGPELILIDPPLDDRQMQPARQLIASIRATVDDLRAARAIAPETRARLTGDIALSHEELGSVQTGLGWAGLVTVIAVGLMLGWCFRSGRLVGATLATLFIGFGWTAGFTTVVVGELNLISVAFAVLFVGLSVDFGIHFALRYREARARGLDHPASAADAAGGVGAALTLTAVAAGIGFLSFWPTDYRGLAELGLISAAGMVFALIANLTVLPALLTLMPPHVASGRVEGTAPTVALFERNRLTVLIGAALVAAIAGAHVPLARFDVDPMNLRDPGTESVSTLHDLLATGTVDIYSASIIADDLDAAAEIARRLKALPETGDVRMVTDYVPRDQDDKLFILEDLAFLVLPSISGDPGGPIVEAGTRRAAVSDLVAALEAIAANEALAVLKAPSERLVAALESAQARDDDFLAALETAIVGDLPQVLGQLKASLEVAEPATLADLPAPLRERDLAGDGRARVTAYPADSLDMTRQADLQRFVEAVQTAFPEATGPAVGVLEGGKAVIQAFIEAAVLSLVLIVGLLLLVLRRIDDALIVLAPLTLAALALAMVSVWAGLPFNFANIIVLPLLFGLGVASGIHMVMRARQGDPVFESSTPRAVIFSALTTIGSFGSISLSSHPGTASMGIMLTLALVLTLIATFGVLPALLPTPSARKTTG